MPELGDVGLPEEVDGLFRVADDEEGSRFPAEDDVDDGDLDGVGVLELVDQDEPEPVPEMRRDLFVVDEEPAGAVDQVIEVERVTPPLLGLHRPNEGMKDLTQVVEERKRRPGEGVVRVEGEREGCLVILDAAFEGDVSLPEAIEVVSRPVLPLPHVCPEPRAPVDLDERIHRPGEVPLDGPEVGLGRIPLAGVAGGKTLEHLDRGAGTVSERERSLLPLFLHDRPPGVEHRLLVLCKGGKERFGVIAVPGECDKVVLQLVGPYRPEGTDHRLPVLCRRVAVDEVVHRFIAEQGRLPLIEDGKRGADVRLERKLAEDRGAEGVEGRYLRPEELIADRIPRLAFLLGEGLPDPDLHLRGRLLGEGQGEDAPDTGALFKEADVFPDQDMRLSCPGPGGDALAPRVVERGPRLALSQSHRRSPPRPRLSTASRRTGRWS